VLPTIDPPSLTHKKRVRWAASVYARNEPELRQRAEKILREELGEEVILQWMEGEKAREGTGEVEEEVDLSAQESGSVGFTDGSRMEGVVAGATAEGGIFWGI